jgi:glycosyltransferase involved in cell wall biosynthesis
MASAAIFAAPSVYEPFGLAVLEAAQLGTPLVLADNATFRELWTGAAVFVDPHDHVAWATTLRTVLDAPDYCAELGIHALSRSKMYSAKAMVASTLAIHRAVAMQPV